MLKLEEVYLKIVKGINWIDSSDKKINSQDLKATFKRNSPPIFPNCRQVELNTTGMPKHIKIDLRKAENVSFHMNICVVIIKSQTNSQIRSTLSRPLKKILKKKLMKCSEMLQI